MIIGLTGGIGSGKSTVAIFFSKFSNIAIYTADIEAKKHFQEFVKLNADKFFIIYENAILFESKSNKFCDVIISVFSNLDTRIQRVIERDNVTKEEVIYRIKNQMNEESKLLQSNYIILNEELENTQNQVKKIHNILTKKIDYF